MERAALHPDRNLGRTEQEGLDRQVLYVRHCQRPESSDAGWVNEFKLAIFDPDCPAAVPKQVPQKGRHPPHHEKCANEQEADEFFGPQGI